jgi:hypothetical protein
LRSKALEASTGKKVRKMRFEVTHDPKPADLKSLADGFRAFELAELPDLPDASADVPIAVFARDGQGAILGGVKANIYMRKRLDR